MSTTADIDVLENKRIKLARAGLTKKLATVWRAAKDVSVEYELVARSGGPLGGGCQSTTEADNPGSVAAWAVDVADEYLIDTGASGQTGFILRFGSKQFQFYLTPDAVGEGTVNDQLQQALAHNEALAGLYIETTGETIKSLTHALTQKDAALATKDATITAMLDKQVQVAQAYAQVMDTKYVRDIEMRQLERKEARYDMGASKVLGMLDSIMNIAGPKLLEKIEEKMSPHVLDKLASLLTPAEQNDLARLVQVAQTRALQSQQVHDQANAKPNGAPPAANGASGAGH